jgi:hypothetical protein
VRLARGDDQHVAAFERPRLAQLDARAAAHIEGERREVVRDGSIGRVPMAGLEVRSPFREDRRAASCVVVDANVRVAFHDCFREGIIVNE